MEKKKTSSKREKTFLDSEEIFFRPHQREISKKTFLIFIFWKWKIGNLPALRLPQIDLVFFNFIV